MSNYLYLGEPEIGLGVVTMDGTGLLGTGLFAGGMDVSTWGAGEFAVLAFGFFALYSMTATTHRAGRAVADKARRTKGRVKRGYQGLSPFGGGGGSAPAPKAKARRRVKR